MSPETDSVIGLASRVLENAQLISDGFGASDTTLSSLNDDPYSLWPVQLSKTRSFLLEDIARLQQLISDPRESLMEVIQPEITAVHIIFEFKVAQAVPVAGEAVAYPDIAAETGLPERELRRALKLAMMRHIFRETEDGKVAHTAASKLLATDRDLIDWADVSYREILPAKWQTAHSLKKFPGSQDPSESGFAIANEQLDMFSYFQAHPDRAKLFARGMNAVHKRGGFKLSYLTDEIPLRDELMRAGTCVDMGGGNGATMLALAEALPGAHCIVQDLSSTIECHVAVPQELTDRVKFMTHDFFKDQPIKGACIYLLRNILHNWSDAKCTDILKGIANAMNETSRIVINDWCLGEVEDNVDTQTTKKKREMDINMLSLLNSRERSVADWQKLIESSGQHLFLESVKHPHGSNYSVMSIRRGEKVVK